MKTNTVRVRQNGASESAISQEQNAANAEVLKQRRREHRLEQNIYAVVALIDLLESKICKEKPEATFSSHPEYDPVYSAEICGLQTFCHQVKKELVETFYQSEAAEVAS